MQNRPTNIQTRRFKSQKTNISVSLHFVLLMVKVRNEHDAVFERKLPPQPTDANYIKNAGS